VVRTAERGITITLASDQVESLPPPPDGAATFRPNVSGGRLSRLFGGGWKRE
jgi:hypothetical protein